MQNYLILPQPLRYVLLGLAILSFAMWLSVIALVGTWPQGDGGLVALSLFLLSRPPAPVRFVRVPAHDIATQSVMQQTEAIIAAQEATNELLRDILAEQRRKP